jgi:pyruvate dehydrogenase E1 component beta subunit
MPRKITYIEAVNEGLAEEMRRDPTVIYYGQNIAMTEKDPFLKEFGRSRVRITPVSETAQIGMAIGAAIAGLRPVVELWMTDFVLVAMDQLLNEAPRMRFVTGGQVKVPVVFKIGYGFVAGWSVTHSNCWYNLFNLAQGSKLVIPSTPYDAKGLIKTAIRDDNPVFYLTPWNIIMLTGEVPDEEYTIPFGVADIKREGDDVTVVAIGWMVHRTLAAAERLAKEGISIEVIDPRTLVPLDKKTILNSVKKTGRLIIVDQAQKTGSVAGEIAAIVAEEGFDYLKAPIKRVCALDTSIAYSKPLEEYIIPNEDKIIATVKEIVKK